MTPMQSKAARALLQWTQRRLADEAAVGISTVADFERGFRTSREKPKMRECLETFGITFLGDNGVIFHHVS